MRIDWAISSIASSNTARSEWTTKTFGRRFVLRFQAHQQVPRSGDGCSLLCFTREIAALSLSHLFTDRAGTERRARYSRGLLTAAFRRSNRSMKRGEDSRGTRLLLGYPISVELAVRTSRFFGASTTASYTTSSSPLRHSSIDRLR